MLLLHELVFHLRIDTAPDQESTQKHHSGAADKQTEDKALPEWLNQWIFKIIPHHENRCVTKQDPRHQAADARGILPLQAQSCKCQDDHGSKQRCLGNDLSCEV